MHGASPTSALMMTWVRNPLQDCMSVILKVAAVRACAGLVAWVVMSANDDRKRAAVELMG